MEDVRCACHKIICQVDGNTVMIKCRHCKRYVVIKAEGQIQIETWLPEEEKFHRRLISQEIRSL
ncbi:hypothetical protein SY88_03065 [Clostridiales bacterium PH28_bin88]|nr:hypothetical protein SY88_03065 [Clostridiales bacterium PH28_bin88]